MVQIQSRSQAKWISLADIVSSMHPHELLVWKVKTKKQRVVELS
nr:MAG TPA: hypothetical protein [Caudoviricetes sp.]